MSETSFHFSGMVAALNELRDTYLPETGDRGGAPSSPQEQELARAFAILAHAEIEYFIERICEDAADVLMDACVAGRITSASLSFLAFSAFQPLNGGEDLGSGSRVSRKLSTQFGQAKKLYKILIAGNEGIRERNLARLFVPLGLTSDSVDSTWIAEIDALATLRGQFAHMSRATKEASPQGINPSDVLKRVNKIVFSDPTVSAPNWVASLEDLDAWVSAAVISTSSAAAPRFGIVRRIVAALLPQRGR